MQTGNVQIVGRIALFAEFFDRRTKRYQPGREAASESVAGLLAAGLPTHAIGFRFFTKVVAEAATPAGPCALSGEHLETGPRHFVGSLVSRAYLVALGPDPVINIGALDTLIARFDANPSVRIARIDAREYLVLEPGDVVVDVSGREVTEPLGAPDGWSPVTEFTGRSFCLDVTDTVLGVRSLGEATDVAEVHLNVAPIPPGLPAAIVAAAHGKNVGIDAGRGILNFRDEASLRIPIYGRVLQLDWNGKTLHAELSLS